MSNANKFQSSPEPLVLRVTALFCMMRPYFTKQILIWILLGICVQSAPEKSSTASHSANQELVMEESLCLSVKL